MFTNITPALRSSLRTYWMVSLMLAATLGALLGCASPAPTPTPTAPPLANELIFYDWEDDMPQSVLDAFTREFGVNVTYKTYATQEEAIEKIRAGEASDVVVMEYRLIPSLVTDELIVPLDHRNVPNLKNISASFRDLAHDPGNKYSVPFNWGTSGLVVRSDLIAEPVTRWADLWDPRYAGRAGIWEGMSREVLALTLKTLGYSANSENPVELQTALDRLLLLKPHVRPIEDFSQVSSAPALLSGEVAIAQGWAYDVLLARKENSAITYVLPKEGALMWGDTFAIPANSPRKYTAEVFINFLLRAEIGAAIANENYYATPNEAALPLINPELLNDPVIFPPNELLKNAEIVMPLSPGGEIMYDAIWQRYLEESR
ncbi:MAG: spermidine/putrescine ABC transporter substrate-binding protein [Chloroflexi bacterium]|nr:spermidine/putrescine ABC transporter substrate-binding protein [Chloroflexota bacterium]